MFKLENLGEIPEISNDLKSISRVLVELDNTLKSLAPRINELEQKQIYFENKIDKKLIDFYKEFTDKYFENIAAFINWNKDIALVAHLDKKDLNIDKLKQSLMKPFVEEQWKETNAKKAIAINNALSSKGEKVRLAWEKYRDEKLKLEREQKPTTYVDAKLEVLNVLMDGVEVSEIQT